MGNYDMSLPPGRTYKYYSGPPLFEFGSGLSLTTFTLDCHHLEDQHQQAAPNNVSSLSFSCNVANTGSRDGDEVLMAFHAAGPGIRYAAAEAGHPVPLKSLVGFDRVSVAAGRSVVCVLELGMDSLLLVNGEGDRVLYRGERSILVSDGAGQQEKFIVTA
jgi:beta-glucosidase